MQSGNDGKAGRAAADRDLPLPLIEKSLDECESLSPARITEATDALDQGGFQRGNPLPAPTYETTFTISSFGEDNARRLYVVDYGGAVYRLNDS